MRISQAFHRCLIDLAISRRARAGRPSVRGGVVGKGRCSSPYYHHRARSAIFAYGSSKRGRHSVLGSRLFRLICMKTTAETTEKVLEFLGHLDRLSDGVVVAVSGGPDSMALAHLLLGLRSRLAIGPL